MRVPKILSSGYVFGALGGVYAYLRSYEMYKPSINPLKRVGRLISGTLENIVSAKPREAVGSASSILDWPKDLLHATLNSDMLGYLSAATEYIPYVGSAMLGYRILSSSWSKQKTADYTASSAIGYGGVMGTLAGVGLYIKDKLASLDMADAVIGSGKIAADYLTGGVGPLIGLGIEAVRYCLTTGRDSVIGAFTNDAVKTFVHTIDRIPKEVLQKLAVSGGALGSAGAGYKLNKFLKRNKKK